LAVVESLQEKLHQRYLAEAGKEMSKEDAEAVRKWMDEFATSRVAKALEAADGREKRWLQKAIDEDDESLQRHIVWQFIGRGKIPPPDEEDHRRLDAAMSKELREKFARARTNEERSRVVNSWIMGAMSFRRGWGGPSDEDLKKELEKLPEEERQRISTLSPEMMREALKRKWWESRFNRGRPGRGERGPGDRPPGPPPGSPPGRGNRGNDDRDGDDRDGDRRGGRRRDNDDRDGNRDDRRRGDRDRGDNDRDDERGRDDERDGRRDDSQAHENGDAKPLEKPEDKSADQSGDQSGERPADGDAAAVRRALIRTYGAT
jgi:hypothetical protein